MTAPATRAYRLGDRAACLAVFDSNVPKFFAAHERAEFAAFLEALPGPYLVVERNGEIIACGGTAMNGPGVAALCWGMARADVHGEGVGALLLQARLAALRAQGAVDFVDIQTSQHTQGFFEKFGFQTQSVAPNGFAEGIDLVAMRLALT